MDNFNELVKKYTDSDLNEKQLNQFDTLAKELLEANKTTNLTAIRDLDGVYIKHFLDSLTLLKAIPENTKTIIDIGSGAGFPGLPLAIARPDIKVTMVESIGKKVAFIESTIKTLDLKNAVAINERAERLANIPQHAERYDVAVARAVAFLPILVEYCLPLVRKGGIMIAMKNENETEVMSALETIKKLNGTLGEVILIDLPNIPKRQLVVIRK